MIKRISQLNGYVTEWEIIISWAILLEKFALENLNKKNKLQELIKEVQHKYQIHTTSYFYWKNHKTHEVGRTIIGFFIDHFEIGFVDAVATLSHYLNISIEHIFNVNTIENNLVTLLPECCKFENCIFTTLKTYKFSQHDGVAICTINDRVIPFQIGFDHNNQAIIGGTRSTHWLNQSIFQKNITATIVLFLDIITAIDIMEYFQQKNSNSENYICTACPHWDFDKLNFSYFKMKTVLLVYSSNTISVKQVKNLSKKLTDESARIKYCDCEIINGKFNMSNVEENHQKRITIKNDNRYCVDLLKFSSQDNLLNNLDSISVIVFENDTPKKIKEEQDEFIFRKLSDIPEIGTCSQERISTIADMFLNSNTFGSRPSLFIFEIKFFYKFCKIFIPEIKSTFTFF